MPKTIAIVGALDTKGDEFAFVKNEIERRGHGTLVIDTGVIGDSAVEADVSRTTRSPKPPARPSRH